MTPLLGSLESFCPCQLGLALVEGPKSLSFQFQGAGYMKAVERSHSKFRAIAAGEFGAGFESVFRHCCFYPCPAKRVIFQVTVHLLSLVGR